MDPISERILLVIEAKLPAILKSGGYKTDAGKRVVRARPAGKELPFLAIWEGSENVTATKGSKHECELTFTIEAYTKADHDETGRMLGLLRADVKKCIMGMYQRGEFFDADTPVSQRISGLAYTGSQPIPREDGSQSEGVTLTFVATYPEAVGDPYHDT